MLIRLAALAALILALSRDKPRVRAALDYLIVFILWAPALIILGALLTYHPAN